MVNEVRKIMDKKIFREMFEDKIILITGGIGSIGSAIVNNLLKYNPREIRIFDNREIELFNFKRKFEEYSEVSTIFGDIRELDRLVDVTKNVDIIFHTAAMKHVVICEYNPFEAVKTNVIGTQNIIKCALHNNVEKMILISTDKAVNPSNVMGATKLLAERLVSAARYYNKDNNKTTKFGIVRFGNVLSTRGSVLEIWWNQLKLGRKITVTDPNMTRFFMDIDECINLVFQATYYGRNGEVFILKMPSVRIGDLAESFLEILGFPSDYYEITGMRIGEKKHEELISPNESKLLLENEKMFVRLPLIFLEYKEFQRIDEYQTFVKLGFKKAHIKSYSSNNKKYILSKNKIKIVLKKVIDNFMNMM